MSEISAPKYQDLRRFSLPPGFRGRSAVYVQLWWITQALLFRPSPQVFYGWRRLLLRIFGAKVGKHVLIRPTARVTYPWKVKIGDYSQIGDRVELYSLGEIDIGSNCVISQDCYICAGGHLPDRLAFDIYSRPIVIESEVWLAAQCFVMPGLRIGKGSRAKVRALITKSVPEGSVVAGQPGRIVGRREQGALS